MTESRMIPLYRQIARAVDARNNRRLKMIELRNRCSVAGVLKHDAFPEHFEEQYNQAVTWFNNWEARLEAMERVLPSGSGFDSGTTIELGDPGESAAKRSIGERLVFKTAFHHMGEHGMYTEWTEHLVIVTPSLIFDLDVRVTGRDHNDIKDYIRETFDQALRTNYPDNQFTEE